MFAQKKRETTIIKRHKQFDKQKIHAAQDIKGTTLTLCVAPKSRRCRFCRFWRKGKSENYHRISHGRFAPEMVKGMKHVHHCEGFSFGLLSNVNGTSTRFHIGPEKQNTIDALILHRKCHLNESISAQFRFSFNREPSWDINYLIAAHDLMMLFSLQWISYFARTCSDS